MQINRYRLPISLILNFATPARRFRQVVGVTVQLYPLTMALSGISTVRLNWGEMRGRQPSMTDLRYALKAFVVSFRLMLKRIRRNVLASRLICSFSQG